MKTENSTVYVTKTVGPAKGLPPPSGEEDIIAIHQFVTEPAIVGANIGLTLNLGNYNAARIDVFVKVPCYKEEIDEAYEFAQAWAEERIKKERDLIVGDRGDNASY